MLSLSPAPLSLMQGDEGGGRVLQQRWTSFLKAQLLCLRPDDGFPFNMLQDMFTLTPRLEKEMATLQCSCLENPRDGGAWWAATYGVAQSRT